MFCSAALLLPGKIDRAARGLVRTLMQCAGTTRGVCTFCAVLVLLGALVACSGDAVPPDSHKTEALLRSVYPAVAYGPATDVLDIYVDDSGSMKGFLKSPTSNYRRLIAQVWNSAAASRYSWTTHTFSSKSTRGGNYRLQEVEGTSFYSALDTPLTRVIHQVAEHLNAQPSHAAILISDLVQSEHAKDSVDLAGELGKLVALHPQIKLFGYRSDFDDSYKPERGGVRIRLNNSQSVEGQGRPFYVLMIAPNPETMRSLQKYLLSGVKEVEVFDPTAAPLTIDGIGLTPDPKGHSPWSSYSRTVSNDREPNQLDTGFKLIGAPASSSTVTLPVTLKFRSALPLRDVSSLGIESFRAAPGAKEPTQAPIRFDGSLDSTKGAMLLRLNLARPSAYSWDVYLIRLRAGDANLNVPQWITDWDTDNDGDAGNGNRTYQLKVLAQTMVNNITEKEVCAEWVLKVGEGK